MACYLIEPEKPSHSDFLEWKKQGYTGDYDRYLAAKKITQGPIIVCGDLGKHCSDCMRPAENLCDYPVGDDITCDRVICDKHSNTVGDNMHYCSQHYQQWREYLKNGDHNAKLLDVLFLNNSIN